MDIFFLALYSLHPVLANSIYAISPLVETSGRRSYRDDCACVSLPGSNIYMNEKDGTDGYWAVNEAVLTPACRITPKNSKEVSLAMRELASLNCQFAIRGGGHMWWAGAVNIQDSVTMDLSSMNEVKVSEDSTVTSVGGGARWEDVYLPLDYLNLSVVGGRVSTVGVRGLTTGGDNSWFAAGYGLACDNVKNFDVVLASGQIVNANISHFPNLFKALKGGNNNFGVVTSFDLRTFPQGKLWGGSVYYPLSTWTELLQALTEFNAASGSGVDDYASGYSVFAYNGSVRNLSNLQPQLGDTLRVTNLTALTVEAAAPGGYRAYWASVTFANNATILERVLSLLDQASKPIQNITGFSASVSFLPVSQAVIRKMRMHGGNSLGLGPINGNQIWLGLTLGWANVGDDAIMFAAGEHLLKDTSEIPTILPEILIP